MTITDTDLATQVAELRAELGALREQLATEVRTRRLVVIDQNDREVIYTTVTKQIAQLRVEWDGPVDDVGSSVIIQADNELAEERYSAGVSVEANGSIVGWLYGESVPYEGWDGDRMGTGGLSVSREISGQFSGHGEHHLTVDPWSIKSSRDRTCNGGGVVRFEYDAGGES